MLIPQVRLQSAAGYYIGTIDYTCGEYQPYARDSLYYPSEEILQHEYPQSISLSEAIKKGRNYDVRGIQRNAH